MGNEEITACAWTVSASSVQNYSQHPKIMISSFILQWDILSSVTYRDENWMPQQPFRKSIFNNAYHVPMSQQSVCLAVEGDVLSGGGEGLWQHKPYWGFCVRRLRNKPLKLSCATQMALLESRVALSSVLRLHTWTESDRTCRGERKKERATAREGEVKPGLAAVLREIPFFRGQGPVYCRQSDCIMGQDVCQVQLHSWSVDKPVLWFCLALTGWVTCSHHHAFCLQLPHITMKEVFRTWILEEVTWRSGWLCCG